MLEDPAVHACCVSTYYVLVNLTLSVNEETVQKARHRAETLGTSINQLVREYLRRLAGEADPEQDAAEFERLSRLAQGNSRGWKLNREKLHERG